MEFGIFHEFPSAPAGDAAAFDQAMALVDEAESGGLDAVWLAELHFDPDRSVLSAPLCIASAIAARTRRIKIGIAVQVLPLCHPLRLAEEAATVDQLSRGRLILGVGRSGVARTYESYGVPYAESRDRFAEVLDILRMAWAHTGISYEGRFHRFDGVTTTPRPFQAEPPIRIAATSAETYPVIGRAGAPVFVAIRHEPAAHVAPPIRAYREAWQEAGHPGRGQVFLRFPAYVAETDAQARAEAEPSLLHYYRAQAALLSDSASRVGGSTGEIRRAQADRLATMTFEEACRGMVLIGSPETVAVRLHDIADELELDGVLMELNPGGRIPHAQVQSALRLLCEQVVPRFRG
jgi:alkanesulfonate monooxygenase SsuD/methylene tetrahydromethanopterin reductase-like flavin-dependent oxidoreductase (luciferase family)